MKFLKLTLLLLPFILISCGVQKSTVPTEPQKEEKRVDYAQLPDFEETEEEIFEEITEETLTIIDHALAYLGTAYKYGGTTPEGMDCSGLLYTTFLQYNIELPRSSRDMALLGEKLDLPDIRVGDLVFFITDRRKKNINHVGLVVGLDANTIRFIHSSTSKGVIISALDENYWREHFVMARRIL